MAQELTPSQQEALTQFREVTAGARDDDAAVQLLQSCGWNVEQALHLHWAHTDEDEVPTRPSASSSAGELGAPLLGDSQARPSAAAPTSSASTGAAAAPRGTAPAAAASPAAAAAATARVAGPTSKLMGWISRGLRRIGATFVNIVCTFIFGPNGPRLGGPASGAAFGRALTASYGSQLQLPRFFEGSFAQALQAAQRELKLLVVFLHSEHAQAARSFCSGVLCSDLVRTMLDENFLLWGGDIARMESHNVSQMIHARQYPFFCVLLPASMDEVPRVLGTLQGEVQVEQAASLLVNCFEAMESHRAEIVARREQHAEDRHLREQQDREYQEALAMDRKRAEEQQRQEQEEAEARRAAEEQRRLEEVKQQRLEAERCALEEERRQQATALEPEGPEATARIAVRLPAGQRTQRKFRPDATLADVYAWAGCVGHLPENKGRGLEIPRRFMLKMSFPSRDLTEMDSTIQDLQLSGTNLLLAEIEEDD